jgi:hypothetical protein
MQLKLKLKHIYDMTEDEIMVILTKHTEVRTKEKKEMGEVMTHPTLIQKILDLFPKHIWANPNLKWLDPACGIGNFMILVYKRLMDGLQLWETDTLQRHNHIVRKMLFMVEMNVSNCDICKQIFGETDVNIICEDFLSDHKYTFETFDCVVGNPPFQDDITKKKGVGRSKLYERIFLKVIKMLNDNGYLGFLTPTNIFSGNGVIAYKTLVKKQVDFVSLNLDIKTFFPKIQQDMCYFLMRNTDSESESESKYPTIIENQNGDNIHYLLLDRPVNPVNNWTNQTEQLVVQYLSNERNKVKYNRGKNLSEYTGTNYSLIYSSSKKLQTNKLELAVGLGIKKVVIFAMSQKYEFEMDYNGEYGVGPNTFYIPFLSSVEGEKIETFLKSEDYKCLVNATKTNRQFLKIGFIEYLIPFL